MRCKPSGLAQAVSVASLLLAVAVHGPPLADHGRTKDTGVYYMNLFANVEIIDEKGIEEAYDLTSVVRRIVPKIVESLAAEELPSTGFEVSLVRLKLVPPKGPPIMLDMDGNVVGVGRPHRLSKESMVRLRKLIYSELPIEWQEVYPRN